MENEVYVKLTPVEADQTRVGFDLDMNMAAVVPRDPSHAQFNIPENSIEVLDRPPSLELEMAGFQPLVPETKPTTLSEGAAATIEKRPHQDTIQFLTAALEANPNVIQELPGSKGMVKKGLQALALFYLQNKGSYEVADALDLPLSTVENMRNILIRQIWELSSTEIRSAHPWSLMDAESQLHDVEAEEMALHDEEHDHEVLMKIEDKLSAGKIGELVTERLLEKVSLGGYKDNNFGSDALFVSLEQLMQDAGLDYIKADEASYYEILEKYRIPVGEVPDAKRSGKNGFRASTHIFLLSASVEDALYILKRQSAISLEHSNSLPFEDTLQFLREAVRDGLTKETTASLRMTPHVLKKSIHILEQYYVAGRNGGDIASDLGITRSSVYNLKNRLVRGIWRTSDPRLQAYYPLDRLQLERPHTVERDMNISRGKGGRATRMAELAQNGHSAAEICQELGITTDTMNKYRHILRRWGVELPYVKDPNEARDAFKEALETEEPTDAKTQNLLDTVSDSFFLSNSKGENALFLPLKELVLSAGFRYAGNIGSVFFDVLKRANLPAGRATKTTRTGDKPLTYLFILNQHRQRATDILQSSSELSKYRKVS